MLENIATAYTYNTTVVHSTTSSGGSGIWAFLGICVLIAIIIGIVTMWKIFTKAGRPGWAAIIPFYNSWVLFEIGGKPGWWILLALIPFVGSLVFVVMFILVAIEIAKRFGKSPMFAILLIVPPLTVVGYIILAFGKAQYHAVSGPNSQPPTPVASVGGSQLPGQGGASPTPPTSPTPPVAQ